MTDALTTEQATQLLNQLADTLGVKLEVSRDLPTLSDYLASSVEPSTTSGAAKTYASFWNRIRNSDLGARKLDEVTATDIEAFLRTMELTERNSNRGGYAAKRSCLQAWRRIYSCAVRDELIQERSDPSKKVKMPARRPTGRRALTTTEIDRLFDVVSSGGNGPIGDVTLLRFHLETGARRAGAIGLTIDQIDTSRRTVKLFEKGDRQREMPVTQTLIDGILGLYDERSDGRLNAFWYRKQQSPLTRRRYNTIFERVQKDGDFSVPVSAHWLRHTAISLIERTPSGSDAVAANFGGRQPVRNPVTGLYTTASARETIQAWSEVWSDPKHPLLGDNSPSIAE